MKFTMQLRGHRYTAPATIASSKGSPIYIIIRQKASPKLILKEGRGGGFVTTSDADGLLLSCHIWRCWVHWTYAEFADIPCEMPSIAQIDECFGPASTMEILKAAFSTFFDILRWARLRAPFPKGSSPTLITLWLLTKDSLWARQYSNRTIGSRNLT